MSELLNATKNSFTCVKQLAKVSIDQI